MISGLTTGALVFSAAGIGIVVGAGFVTEAAVGVFFIMMSVFGIPVLTKWIGPKSLREKELRVKITLEMKRNVTELLKELKTLDIKVKRIRMKELTEPKAQQAEIRVIIDENRYATDVYYTIQALEGVIRIEVDEIEN